MYRVNYLLFGVWYEVILPDLATAKAFACDFVDYRIQKIGADFCVVEDVADAEPPKNLVP